jgi:hypothetical protein
MAPFFASGNGFLGVGLAERGVPTRVKLANKSRLLLPTRSLKLKSVSD